MRMESRIHLAVHPIYWLVVIFSKKCDHNCPNFIKRKDVIFKELTGTFEEKCLELRQEDVEAVVKHATIFTPMKENTLWEKKVIGCSPAQKAISFSCRKDILS